MAPDAPASSAWRPQTFGHRNAKQIDNPVIEPLWSGTRVLATVDTGSAVLRDAAGDVVEQPSVIDALGRTIDAASAVLDGYLTADAAQSGVGIHLSPPVPQPTAGDLARQMLVGDAASRRRALVNETDEGAPVRAPDVDAVFVAVDLLMLDGEPLLDVPLLERKRLLDSVVVETDLVRVGVHVRSPVDPWLPTWRQLGFRSLVYKEANGRYRPGQPNEGWALVAIPRP